LPRRVNRQLDGAPRDVHFRERSTGQLPTNRQSGWV
jgi:hypothetical protein